MKRFALFASGTGSNVAAILQAVKSGDLDAVPSFVFSDQPDAPVLQKSSQYGIPAYTYRPRDFASKTAYEQEICALLHQHDVEWIVLAGYMRLLGKTLLNAYEGRIVNIHPSLLPDFPGLNAIGQALDAGVEKSGVTIHYVDAGMDTGPVIVQESVAVESGDTEETLTGKLQRVEHRLYPETLQRLFNREGKGAK